MDKARLESLRRQHAVALEEFRESPSSQHYQHLCWLEDSIKRAGGTVEYDECADGDVTYGEVSDV